MSAVARLQFGRFVAVIRQTKQRRYSIICICKNNNTWYKQIIFDDVAIIVLLLYVNNHKLLVLLFYSIYRKCRHKTLVIQRIVVRKDTIEP
jgi:hypothetical protein